jgi:uncharacterized repeat protein (TIGR01451 family)
MTIRGLMPLLLAVLTLAGCAAGSGRQGTEIVVSGVGPTAQVQGGANAVFMMTVKNTGPYSASNIKVVDNVGNQLRLISITCTATGGASCPSSPSVDMVISSLPNGGALIFAVTVQLDSGATGTVQNTMTASFAEEIDPTQATAAVTASAFSTVTNVVVSGTGPTGTLVGGSTAVFVMTVTNNGPDAATNFNVYDNVGNGLSLVSITCAAKNALCPSTVGVLTAIPTLQSGGVLTFTVTTKVGQNVNGTVTNQMVANIGTNPTQSNDSFFATATVVTADLAVSGTAPAGPLMVGSAASFTMVVTNNGPGTAQNIAITNALSTNVTASGAITCVAANGATCPTTLGPSMTLASMPDTGTVTFTVPFTVNAGASGPVTDTMTVTSSTDARGPQTTTVGVGSGSNFITVTETGSPTVGAGNNAIFSAVVANTGPATATNISVDYTLTGPAGSVANVTCTAAAGIICPAPPLGPSITIPSLGVGRAMNFTFTVPVPTSAAGGGAIINTVTANAIGNNDTTQNTASYSTLPINSDNGTYTVFAANGLQYTMVADFDAGNYVITGNGANITVDFTLNSSGGGYTGTGGSQFRVNTDVIVGGQNFGQGTVIPYIAARVFATTIQQLAGTSGGAYDLMVIDFNGTTPTAAGTARVSGNILSICAASNPVTTTQNCLPNALQSYSLSVDGNLYTAITTGALPTSTFTMPSFMFQEAQIGATSALLSATTDANGAQELIIGLPDAATVAGGTTLGQSSIKTADSEWVNATLSSSEYLFSGALGAESAPLSRISNAAGPFSMLVGALTTSPNPDNGGQIYVMQSYPITVAVGGPGGTVGTSAAEGLIQITTP